MPVTERFVLVLVVLVLGFVGAACWDIALRWYRAFTRAQALIVHRSITPLHRLIEDEDSLPDEAEALYCRPLKSASQARRAPQPERLRSRDDENEYDSKILPNIPDLLQGISTLI